MFIGGMVSGFSKVLVGFGLINYSNERMLNTAGFNAGNPSSFANKKLTCSI